MNCKNLIILFFIIICTSVFSQEVLFTNYFDIEVNKKEGSLVFGKVNLKRNKDFLTSKVPATYKFSIDKCDSELFTIETEFDSEGRIFGVLKVASGKKTPKIPTEINSIISLKNASEVISTENIKIHIVEKIMWKELLDTYVPTTLSTSRLYGRIKLSDKKLLKHIEDLEMNKGRFSFTSMYGKHPSEYNSTKELMEDWENVTNNIGALGYSYANSKYYGIKSSNSKNRERLKRAIYKSVIQFTNSIPIYGDDILIDGKPIGNELGDGISKLSEHNLADHGLLTHQWRIIDGLAAPLVHVWPEVLEGIQNGDKEAQQLYDSVIRYYQLFFSIVPSRRVMNDKSQRWKNISNINSIIALSLYNKLILF